MVQKKSSETNMSRQDFFSLATAAGFGTMKGTYLFGIPGVNFLEGREINIQSIGVLYRITNADVLGPSFSETEVIMEPGSETYVMYNNESEVTYQGVSGQAIVFSGNEPNLSTKPNVSQAVKKEIQAVKTKQIIKPAAGGQKLVQTPEVSRSTKKVIQAGITHQLLNPGKERAILRQRYSPIWKTDKSFIQVGNQQIPGNEIWFELRESLNRQQTGLKYKIVKQIPGQAQMLLRVEPGVQSVDEYHKRGTQLFTVTQGRGFITIDGKRQELGPQAKIQVRPGSKFQLHNPNQDRWELELISRPQWLPNESFYIVDGKEIPGSDVWFGIRMA